MNPQANFISVLRDLESCASCWDDYELMRIPGMLRLLLLDGLVDQVNRDCRLKITFTVGQSLGAKRGDSEDQPVSSLMFSSVGDSFDPEVLARAPKLPPALRRTRVLSRDDLLQQFILVVDGEYVTVEDLIHNLAYVHGLTHPGKPQNQKDANILGWRRLARLGNTPAGLREIRSVGHVVHRALIPLRDSVLKKYGGQDV